MSDRPYLTLARPLRHEIDKIKGSRFIVSADRFSGEPGLGQRIQELRDEFAEANHHCWAWRHGTTFRYNDDGEPSGTAGRPILQQIDGHQLDRVQVVVSRIFGGTKLGAGGLVRAYARAAREALDAASIIEVVPTRRVTVVLPYSQITLLQGVAHAHGLTAVEGEFGGDVRQTFLVPLSHFESFVEALREGSAGTARISVEEAEE